MVGRAEIERRLGYHPANDPQRVAVFELVRQQCTELAVLLDEVLPPGRELAEALTCVQTAQMYAIAAVACHEGEFEAVQTRSATPRAETVAEQIAAEAGSEDRARLLASLSAVTPAPVGVGVTTPCPFRTYRVGVDLNGRWLECASTAGHPGAWHRTADGEAFE